SSGLDSKWFSTGPCGHLGRPVGGPLKPSSVFDIQIENLNTTAVSLRWKINDTVASEYTYRILVEGNGTHFEVNTTTNATNTVIAGLEPGTLYNFTIYSQVADKKTEGDPFSRSDAGPIQWVGCSFLTSSKIYLLEASRQVVSGWDAYVMMMRRTKECSAIHFIAVPKQPSGDSELQLIILNLVFCYLIHSFQFYSPSKVQFSASSSVFDIQIENINTTAVSLRWKINDTVASEYTYRILVEGNGTTSEVITNTSATNTVIAGLEPGTLYNFTIFSQVADKKTEGDPFSRSKYTSNAGPIQWVGCSFLTSSKICLLEALRQVVSGWDAYVMMMRRTKECSAIHFIVVPKQPSGDSELLIIILKPSSVFDIQIENINTTAVSLRWKINDTVASEYTYRIRVEGNGTSSEVTTTTNATNTVIAGLEPGTLYNFTLYSQVADKKTEGDPVSTSFYTKPSPVFDIQIENISTTAVNVSWNAGDRTASEYTYRILVEGNTSEVNKTTNATNIVIVGLEPGTSYNFTIYSRIADGRTEGVPVCKRVYTNPASVSSFNCEPVAKQKILTLQWDCPTGKNSGFKVNFSNGSWHRETEFLPCNTGRQATNSTNLDYFTTYNISIATLSCGKESFPKQATCATSITDPPAPVELPTIISTSHNSLQVQFNEFQSTNGPLEAYAVIITTDNAGSPNSSLRFTYDDFRKKTTKTYVTFVKKVGQKRVSSSSPEEIVVGDGDVTYGYYNGKLDPLGSYRVCVAGFTNIVFSNNNTGPIAEDRSYVAYTHYSMLVSLPQDPGVITGAVVGCLLAAIVIAAVVGFIFWKRRRSKLVKVENFETYFKKQQADSNCGFAEEYEELRSVGVNQPKFAAELPENKGKNRYNNVLPYDISRVKLLIQDHPSEDYINANYMPGYNSRREFIAAQGPLPNTMEDFWRMIWEKDICGVVMLTKCVEQGRTKCEEYWPSKHSKRYGDIIVAMTSEIVLPEWTIRDFSVEKSNSTESHAVRQFHFTAWPDHGVPETTDLLSNFRYLVHEYMKQNPPTSLLVHCSAGVGRTGTFISIDRLIHQMEMENMVDVYGVVYDLRMHRPLMVQTEDQYIFLNQCVLDIIRSQKDKQSDLIYQNTNAMAIYENFTPSPDFRKTNGYHV
uniref:Receptor-type tyrosine-protein phosphatase eta n=1 Tax=Sphenodon punctatus TaxID=8508 RepID=A0A8D0G7X4_SPHPU